MIRLAQVADAPQLQRICEQALGYPASLELVEQQLLKLLQDRDHHMIFVATKGCDGTGQVLGFVHAQRYETFYAESGVNILALAVLPTHHHLGIGRALMAKIEHLASQKGLAFVRLNSGSQRKQAHHFYQRLGYRSDKLQKRFLKELPMD
ncbi:MAG: GNAT family N-acetyltransferase [Streptococcus pyogenes]|nr:MAG: GNAT family N-acetyltransferase [Streptococcus pyogenes]